MDINLYLKDDEKAILGRAKIGVAGIGGLGSNILSHLVRSGIRQFVAADFDTVSHSNLNRQFFFVDQIGKLKTDAVAENLQRINPDVALELHPVRLTADNIQRIFADCDIVVEAFDSADAKTLLIEELRESGKPIVAASGLAGFGRSNLIQVRQIGKRLYLAGDLVSGISPDLAPASPRVGIAAAMQANTVIALLLGREV